MMFGRLWDRLNSSKLADGRASIFISYARQGNELLLQRILDHFKRLEKAGVEIFCDRSIQPGELWKPELRKAIERAAIAIILIDERFVKSVFIANFELPAILRAYKKRGLRVFPFILEPLVFFKHPQLSQFQAVNNTERPFADLASKDQELEIENLVVRVACDLIARRWGHE